MTAPNRWLVVDLANWVARVIFVQTEPLFTSTGIRSDHLLRAFRSLRYLQERWGGELVFALEGGDKNFRCGIYPDYKAGRVAVEAREATAEDPVDPRFSEVHYLAHLCQAIHLSYPTAEADDAIATWCSQHPNDEIIIISRDQDLWYLMNNPLVRVVDGKDVVDSDRVLKKFCNPINIPMWKALFGDKSDNIPSVTRLLKKQIRPFFETFEKRTLSEFFEWVPNNCSKNTIQKVKDFREQIEIMFQVTTLKEDLDLTVHFQEGRPNRMHILLHTLELDHMRGSVREMCGHDESNFTLAQGF